MSSTLVYALDEALAIVEEEGLEARWARHERNHRAFVDGLKAMGMSVLPPEGERLWTLNAVRVPDGVDEAAVRKHLLEEFNIEIGAGLGPLAGKIWRVGLMGASSTPRLIVLLLGALEKALTAQGPPAGDDDYRGRSCVCRNHRICGDCTDPCATSASHPTAGRATGRRRPARRSFADVWWRPRRVARSPLRRSPRRRPSSSARVSLHQHQLRRTLRAQESAGRPLHAVDCAQRLPAAPIRTAAPARARQADRRGGGRDRGQHRLRAAAHERDQRTRAGMRRASRWPAPVSPPCRPAPTAAGASCRRSASGLSPTDDSGRTASPACRPAARGHGRCRRSSRG